jgi:CubicO group peptidase (beta-lactamase class C family)
MQAGLETTSNRNYGAWVLSADWIQWALDRPFEDMPGTRMIYSTGNTHLLSAIIQSATGMDTLQFARSALGEPLGFHLAPWPRDPQGVYFGGNDMELTPRQMLAIGQLYINGGEYRGQRILPKSWIDASWTTRTESEREPGRYYGYGWWIRDMVGFRTPYAWGYGGQFIILVPEIDLVVVTTSSSNPGPDRRRHTRRIYDFAEYEVIATAARTLDVPIRRRTSSITTGN